MPSFFPVTLVAAVVSLPAPVPQQLPIQNGKVETRAATSIDREIATLGAGTEPVWIAWRVPMVDGDRSICSTWVDDRYVVRGDLLDSNPASPNTTGRPQVTPAAGVSLEAGTNLILLARAVNGRLERLRRVTDDCPIDANGRTVYTLTGITTGESLRFLETLTRGDALNVSERRQFAETAISSIGVHRDPAADPILDRLASSATDSSLRQRAASSLGSARGAHGFDTLRALIAAERDAGVRRSFASALGQTRQPGTADALLALARTDTDAQVRASAIYSYVQRAGMAGVPNVMSVLEKDTDEAVKRRAVSGLALLPKDQSIPALIDLARTHKDPLVRKESVRALSESKDPRAVTYLEGLIK